MRSRRGELFGGSLLEGLTLGKWGLATLSEADADGELREHSVPGLLTHGRFSHCELTTIGDLDIEASLNAVLRVEQPKRHVIWGVDINKQKWSLFGAQQTSGYPSSDPAERIVRTRVDWYATGNAWVTPEYEVETVSIEFEGLDEWAAPPIDDDSYAPDRDTNVFTPPDTAIESVEIDGVTVSLISQPNVAFSSHGYHAGRKTSIEMVGTLQLGRVFDEWVDPLRLLLEFLTGTQARVTVVKAKFSGLDEPLSLDFNLAENHNDANTTSRRDDFVAPLAALADVGVGFSMLIKNYWSLLGEPRHQAVLGYLRASQKTDRPSLVSLLDAFKAVECYHNFETKSLPRGEHRKRVREIVESAPDEHKEWLKEQLQDRNRKSLREQLREVVETAKATSQEIKEAWPEIFELACDCRNAVAHGQASTSRDFPRDCHASAVALHWVLRHVYLMELGVDSAGTNQMLQQHGGFTRCIAMLESWRIQSDA